MIRAVLFDLDGTLADTAPDLVGALNLQRVSRGLDPLPLKALRPLVSQGARGLIGAGFGLQPGDSGFSELRDEFLDLYAANLSRNSQLFSGVEALLAELERRGMPWGIVTNKPGRFTEPLVEALELHQRASCVISGDTCARAKPHPDPLLEASRQIGIPAPDCLYLGDDQRDVEASLAAGMLPVVAGYGYLGVGRPPEQWGAVGIISHPGALLSMLA